MRQWRGRLSRFVHSRKMAQPPDAASRSGPYSMSMFGTAEIASHNRTVVGEGVKGTAVKCHATNRLAGSYDESE
jgi:hypothetical protein